MFAKRRRWSSKVGATSVLCRNASLSREATFYEQNDGKCDMRDMVGSSMRILTAVIILLAQPGFATASTYLGTADAAITATSPRPNVAFLSPA